MAMIRSARHVLLAYPHAAARQRAHPKVARRNSGNQGGESPVLARRQKDARRRSGSTASASEITGNPRRINVADRLEKTINIHRYQISGSLNLTRIKSWKPIARWRKDQQLQLVTMLGRFAARLPGFGIVTHVGRKSGRIYRTPVNVFREPDGFLIALHIRTR